MYMYIYIYIFIYLSICILGFLFLYIELHAVSRLNSIITPCKGEQPLRGIELQEKEEQEQEICLKLKHTRNLFKENVQIKGVC